MAIPFVPWEYRASAVEVVRGLRERGYQAIAVEQAHHSVPYSTNRASIDRRCV